MTEFNYSTVLTRCMLISASVLIAGILIPTDAGPLVHLVPFLAALAPLVWYHVGYLQPQAAEGLSQAAIDSVYYYGFLITVGALGATALDLSLHPIGDDFSPVAFRFGLGLLATGYAVWARVQLVGVAKQLDEDEIRTLMAQQITRTRELVSSVEMASSSFQNFAETLISRSSEFASKVEAQTQASINDATNAFRDGISAMTEQAQLALQELRGIVKDVTFGAEREQLKTSVTSMVETVNALSQGLAELTGSTQTGANSANEFAGSLARINDTASSAASELEKLSGENGTVSRFADALSQGNQRTGEFTTATSDAAVSMKGLGDNSAMARDTLQVLAKALDKAKAAAESADDVKASLETLESGSDDSAAKLHQLQASIGELNATLLNLNAALIDSTGGLKDSMSAAEEALDDIARRSASNDGGLIAAESPIAAE